LSLLPVAAQRGSGASPDLDSEPDLAGLLAATKSIRMTNLEPGLSAGTAEYPQFGIRIHVFDFARDRFALRVGEQSAATGNRAPDFFKTGDDVLVVNGGYFERTRRGKLSASGLLIIGGQQVAREDDRAGSGVIYSGRDGVGIAYRKNFSNRSGIDHALQVGPILVDPGGVKGIYKNTGGRFNRSAVCLRGASFTVFVVEGGISLFQLADLLSLPRSSGGFGCDIAINLDGGPSTQAALRSGSARRDIPGESTVHNALIVSRRPGG
jgi:exopolysaccharide biosynthesis protein